MGLGRTLPSGLAIRLTFILLAMTAIGMAVMGLYVTRALETPLMEYLTASMVREAGLLHDAVLPYVSQGTPVGAVQELTQKYGTMLGSEARVTVIAVDGMVLGDSGRELTGQRRPRQDQGTRCRRQGACRGAGGSGWKHRSPSSTRTRLPTRDAPRRHPADGCEAG